MTNKPMLSVERELLEELRNVCGDTDLAAEANAILNNPAAKHQPAPVAVVMPERQIVPDNLMAGLTRKWCEGWNDALEEVARLNGVKP